MVGENLTNWLSQLSLDNLFSGDFKGLIPLFYLAVSIAIYAILIWHFYRYIAKRDCFKISTGRHPKTIGFIKYFLLYPFVAVLFFMGFSMLMLSITKTEAELEQIRLILTTAFAIILAIRITAYYSEDLSKDVAKMIPFALLGVFLVDPQYFNIQTIQEKINLLPDLLTWSIQFIFYIIIIEWILRIILNIKLTIFPKKEKPIILEE